MTFADIRPALQTVVHRRNQKFGDFILRRPWAFFLPPEEREYSLLSMNHFLMKRLSQSYDTLMRMDSETRDSFFKIEKAIFEEEKKANSNNNS